MKLDRVKSRLAVLILLAMLSSIVPVQGQEVLTYSSLQAQNEALESPLYDNLLTLGIKKLESVASSDKKVITSNKPVHAVSQRGIQNTRLTPDSKVCINSTQKAYTDSYSRKTGTSSILMNRDRTPVASNKGSFESNNLY